MDERGANCREVICLIDDDSSSDIGDVKENPLARNGSATEDSFELDRYSHGFVFELVQIIVNRLASIELLGREAYFAFGGRALRAQGYAIWIGRSDQNQRAPVEGGVDHKAQ